MASNGIATQNRAVGSQCRAFLDQGSFQLTHPRDLASRIDDIGEYHRRTTEHVILQRYAFIDGNIILYLYTLSDADIGTDDDILSNSAIFPYPGTLHNVRNMPDACSLADFHVVIDKR